MDTIQIKLNKNKSINSTNVDEYIALNLTGNNKLLPVSGLHGIVDEYEQYVKEYDSSNKYRLILTINPVCSNVLFNRCTEVVYKEGSDLCKPIVSYSDNTINLTWYGNFIKNKVVKDLHEVRTMDTGFSFSKSDVKLGYLEYKCGLDIFNNHHLRRTDFVVINPFDKRNDIHYFNTLFDEVRDKNGAIEKGLHDVTDNKENYLHLYDKNIVMPCGTLREFSDVVDYSLTERDGWFGFVNKSILPIDNTKLGVSINRVIGYKRECDFIDMYPDRTLFSFVPKWNEYRKRAEYNWKYCLTYPYQNVYDNPLVASGITGSFDEDIVYNTSGYFDNETSNILIKTNTCHSFEVGSIAYLSFAFSYKVNGEKNEKTISVPYSIRVESVGKDGYDILHYYSVNLGDITYALRQVYSIEGVSDIKTTVFAKKYINGAVCKYYIRKFKRLPNFKNTQFSNLNKIDNTVIDSALGQGDFNSTINKLAFSKNAYGDDISQIVYNDVIDITGLRDNLGRQLSVIYLTILKNNRGHDKWYAATPNGSSEEVEYSHCFGKVSDGFDLPEYADDYNVHKQHNIPLSSDAETWIFPKSSSTLDSDIKMDSEHYEFYGDIVELDEETLTETVLENVQYRFNTAQREYIGGVYRSLSADNIITDDYDGKWETTTKNLMYPYSFNLAPEGYYYQAHYPIRLCEFDSLVNVGYHTIVNVVSKGDEFADNKVIFNVDKNYYFNVGDEVYLHTKKNNERKNGTINYVSEDYLTIGIYSDEINDGDLLSNYIVMKPNIEMPSVAYDLNDGTGRYIWKDKTSVSMIQSDSELYGTSFTNGVHYIHKQINFFLKRQDPYGIYGLKATNDNFGKYGYAHLEVDGNQQDVSVADYFEAGVNGC